MTSTEPIPTAAILLVVGVLLALSALFSRLSGRLGMPVAMLFLGVGVLAGSEGLGGIEFSDYQVAFRVGSVALTLILFDGGLNTPRDVIRSALRPATVLATAGVLITAAVVALGCRLVGLGWNEALLVGAVVSSTDAAAVFAVLRASGFQLRRRVGTTLELESGLNDPLAVLLTTAVTRSLVSEAPSALQLGLEIAAQLGVGLAFGLVGGRLAVLLLRRVQLSPTGLYPVLTLALALLAFALPTLFFGSGFLAVYVAGILIGNAKVPYRAGLLRVHDAFAWLSQVGMFLLLGLLVYPSRLRSVALVGLAVALVLTFVARPLAVTVCLAFFRFSRREVGYIGWVGLRGAVPIVLAIYPVLLGAPQSERLFDLVFFVVVCNALVPGSTVRWVTRRLGMASGELPAPPAVLEISASRSLEGEVLSFSISAPLAVAGAAIADLPLPDDAHVMMIVRGDRLLAPRGATVLEPGDHVYILCQAEQRHELALLFGHAEES